MHRLDKTKVSAIAVWDILVYDGKQPEFVIIGDAH
jgi:hypothetical protein